MSINDNQAEIPAIGPAGPDAHGQAALLLVESLIHGLCEKATLSPRDAVDIAERAVIVQQTQAEEAEGETAALWRSHVLLSNIMASLRLDDIDGPPLARPVS